MCQDPISMCQDHREIQRLRDASLNLGLSKLIKVNPEHKVLIEHLNAEYRIEGISFCGPPSSFNTFTGLTEMNNNKGNFLNRMTYTSYISGRSYTKYFNEITDDNNYLQTAKGDRI